MGIVVKKADRSFAVLEAGPDDTVWVTLQDLSTRLEQFDRDFHGTITIRRCKKVLPRETSWALTRFAYMQDGKPYAVARLLLQGTSLRSRGPVRSCFWARPSSIAGAGSVRNWRSRPVQPQAFSPPPSRRTSPIPRTLWTTSGMI